jgi:hypothetical protein
MGAVWSIRRRRPRHPPPYVGNAHLERAIHKQRKALWHDNQLLTLFPHLEVYFTQNELERARINAAITTTKESFKTIPTQDAFCERLERTYFALFGIEVRMVH